MMTTQFAQASGGGGGASGGIRQLSTVERQAAREIAAKYSGNATMQSILKGQVLGAAAGARSKRYSARVWQQNPAREPEFITEMVAANRASARHEIRSARVVREALRRMGAA